MFIVWHTLLISFFILLAFTLGYTLGVKKGKVNLIVRQLKKIFYSSDN